MGIFNRKVDQEQLYETLKCRVCGKNIEEKIKKYGVCKECVRNAKILCRKKLQYTPKQKLLTISIVGILLLLLTVNILSLFANVMQAAIFLTGAVLLVGMLLLALSLE